MTRDIKRQITVMQAWQDGEELEVRTLRTDKGALVVDPTWRPCGQPSWAWDTCDYRVKPKEPRRFWLNVYHSGCTYAHHSRADADRVQGQHRLECIEVVEVLRE